MIHQIEISSKPVALTAAIFVSMLGHVALAGDLTIDLSKRYQTIDNFGASDAWTFQIVGGWREDNRQHIADLLFSTSSGIGLSAWRFNLGGGINHNRIGHPWRTVETFEVAEGVYDWTRQDEERWFLQAAKERGVDQFIAFVNSPPGRMTRNGYTNGTDGLGSTNLKENFEAQFATYQVDILKHFRDEWGIEFSYIAPVNEPQWEWNGGSQEGNRASNADIKAMVLALQNELENQDVSAEILVTESGDLKSWHTEIDYLQSKYGETYGNYLGNLIDDPAINSYLGNILGGHSYWSDRLETQLVQHRNTLAVALAPYSAAGWKYWMTEYTVLDGPEGNGGRGRDLGIDTALEVARVIHYDLTILNASAWQWWTAMSPEDYKDGLIYTDYMTDPTTESIIESKLLWALGNYSRFIRPGAQRVKLTGASDKHGLMASAYSNDQADDFVIVLVNIGSSAEDIDLTVIGADSGFVATTLTPYITSADASMNLSKGERISIGSTYSVPARSVVTLVGDLTLAPSESYFEDLVPDEWHLYQNYPNPFNQSTQIIYYLPEPAKVELSIYSLLGIEVKTVVAKEQFAGIHQFQWDGTDNLSRTVSSGIYLYSLQAGSYTDSKKMVLVQ